MSKLRPAGHRVLVRLKPIEEVSKAGIILHLETAKAIHQKATQEATIISLGPTAYRGFDDGTPWCKPGDLVLIAKYSGEDRENPETKEIFRIINDDDVLAIIEEEI